MKLKREDIEIMAPVGSFESLHAAVQGGADSVYFGLEKLNMRSRSSGNFSVEDLNEIVRICKTHQIKSYLTLNVVVYDHELGIMRDLIDAAKCEGVTAVIASDMSVISYAMKAGVEVHISTQLNISNIEALMFYAQFADVMVLARELDMEQVKNIKAGIDLHDIRGPKGDRIKLEMFAHGALCMSISGKCYLSLHEYNHSANRGACFQTCRRGYTVTDNETGRQFGIENEYIMSPKDLMTIHFLNKMIDSGIRVFKIEGRARPAEYVKTVVSCYNEAIHAILNDSYTTEKIEQWKKRLSTVFNRGFWDGYYLGQKLGEWSHVYGSKATKKKIYVGKGMNYFSKIGVAEFQCEASDLSVGDEILITGPTTGVIESEVKEIRVDLKSVQKAIKGERFSVPLDSLIRRSDKLYKVVENKKI